MRNEEKGRSKNGPAIRPRLHSFDSLSATASGFWVADKRFLQLEGLWGPT